MPPLRQHLRRLPKPLRQRLPHRWFKNNRLKQNQPWQHPQIDTWGLALSHESLHALLLRRLRGALAEANVFLLRGAPLDLITRRLMTRGAPAAVAPALAVLIAHRAL